MSFFKTAISYLFSSRSSTPTSIEERSATPITPTFARYLQDSSRTSPLSSPKSFKETKEVHVLFASEDPDSPLEPMVDSTESLEEIQKIFGSMFKTTSGKQVVIQQKKIEPITLLIEGNSGLKEKNYLVYRQRIVDSGQNTPYPCLKKSKRGRFKKYLLFEPKKASSKIRQPFESQKLSFHRRAAHKNLALKCIRVVASVASGLNPFQDKYPCGKGLNVEYDSKFLSPFAENGDLLSFLNNNNNYPITERLTLGLKILKKFTSLHKLGIMHRDIKPENILIDNKEPFICDFGFAQINRFSSKSCGTEKFTPPEYMPKKFLGESLYLENAPEPNTLFSVDKIDLYTLGSTLFTTLTNIFLEDALLMHKESFLPPIYLDEWNYKPFSEFQVFRKEFVNEAIATFLDAYPEPIIAVIQGLTALDPDSRMPLKEAIKLWSDGVENLESLSLKNS